jgi:hypothetical protein
MSWYYLEKEFYDYAEDIEGVNIHYVWTPLGGVADWENQRATRFMPLVRLPSPEEGNVSTPSAGSANPSPGRLRKKILKLPQRIPDTESGTLTDRYLLHHYFEIFQNGYRHYSPLYTEEILTGAGSQRAAHDTEEKRRSVGPLPVSPADVKQSKE